MKRTSAHRSVRPPDHRPRTHPAWLDDGTLSRSELLDARARAGRKDLTVLLTAAERGAA